MRHKLFWAIMVVAILSLVIGVSAKPSCSHGKKVIILTQTQKTNESPVDSADNDFHFRLIQ